MKPFPLREYYLGREVTVFVLFSFIFSVICHQVFYEPLSVPVVLLAAVIAIQTAELC